MFNIVLYAPPDHTGSDDKLFRRHANEENTFAVPRDTLGLGMPGWRPA
jgi:hypothetical protein